MDNERDMMELAAMVLSDCGISTATSDRLQRRVAERIQRHIGGLAPAGSGEACSAVIEQVREACKAACERQDRPRFSWKKGNETVAAYKQGLSDCAAAIGALDLSRYTRPAPDARMVDALSSSLEWALQQCDFEAADYDENRMDKLRQALDALAAAGKEN